MKVLVREPETDALLERLETSRPRLATSTIARIEVTRAVRIAPGATAAPGVEQFLATCLLVDASREIVARAAELASRTLRALDALHLATALHVRAEAMLVYDRRLADAARAHGMAVLSPGA